MHGRRLQPTPEILQTLNLWCAGFRVCEVGAGTGGLTRDAFPRLDMDNNCEMLQYTATDISSVWAPRLLESISSAKLQFKARPITNGFYAHALATLTCTSCLGLFH